MRDVYEWKLREEETGKVLSDFGYFEYVFEHFDEF